MAETLIALIAILLVSQPDVSVPTYSSSVTSSRERFVTISEDRVERLKKITVDAIAKAQHLRIDLDVCLENKADVELQRDKSRRDNSVLKQQLAGSPSPAKEEDSDETWWVPYVVVGVGLIAGVVGAVGCATLNCEL